MSEAIDVERVVREVLARLSAGGTPVPRPAATETKKAEGELALSEKLVTLAALEGRLAGVKQLVVPAKAVITPAARDLLRERKIAVVRGTSAGAKGIAAGSLLVGVAETSFDATRLIARLREIGVEVEQLAKTGLTSVCGEVAEGVALGGKLGLILSGNGPAAICLANRRRGVRAALGQRIEDVDRAIKTIGANLLVVEPSRVSLFEMRRSVEAFCRGPRTIAAEFAAALS
jgi:ribose 5-phosphate isomerase RpiB